MRFDPPAEAPTRHAVPATAAFDGLVADYDATFTCSAVGRALRAIVWDRLEAGFTSCRTVIELGCGTGEDALWLASRGPHVLATDASAAMITLAQQKANAAPCADRVEFRCLPMETVGSALAGRTFDGVLSNFGAINCVGDLPALAVAVSDLTRRGAKLLWVLMGRHVPWEWFWYGSRGEWAKALRRTRPSGVSWRGLRVSYPTPAAVTRCLEAASFRIDRVTPLGVILPPSYASGWLDRAPRALATLVRLEGLARRSRALANLSDHYIVEATRR